MKTENKFMFGIEKIVSQINAGKISAVEVAEYFNQKIAVSQLNSFITPCPELAIEQAKKIDEKRRRGEKLGRLAGVPVAIKDVIMVKGVRATGGSRILENYIAPYDATVVEKLTAEDAIIIGKTNCDEFAMGSSGENSGFGPTKNPWDMSRVPGGSSSGSAAAVAAGECVFSLGTDTGGSIRQPAAFCGVVGLKPTYGRVSRFGLMAMTSSLDQAGPFTRTVADAALVMEIISGKDERDATAADQPVVSYSNLQNSFKGWRLGVVKEFFGSGIDKEVADLIKQAIKKIANLGAEIVEVSVPSLEYALAVYYVICPSEVSANLARYDGVRYGQRYQSDSLWQLYTNSRGNYLGAEVKRRLMLGTYVLSAGYYESYYQQALKVQQVIKQDFDNLFAKVDLLISPTTPTPAFSLQSKINDPLTMYLADSFTVPVNIAGLPAVSVPAGFNQQGLPVGLQIIGPAWAESKILSVAHTYEQSEDWHKKLSDFIKSKF